MAGTNHDYLSYPLTALFHHSLSLIIPSPSLSSYHHILSFTTRHFYLSGTGVAGFNHDLHPATASQLAYPYDLAIDTSGNLYISDTVNNRIRIVTSISSITATTSSSTTTTTTTTSSSGAASVGAVTLTFVATQPQPSSGSSGTTNSVNFNGIPPPAPMNNAGLMRTYAGMISTHLIYIPLL